MRQITIANLFIYPIKSSKGIKISSSFVLKTGFEFDRNFGIINSNNEMITARENAYLLNISTEINNEYLTISHPKKDTLTINLKENNTFKTPITVFNKNSSGILISEKADKWISDILKEPSKLIKIDTDNLRKVNFKDINTSINYTDSFPIHLITTSSLNDLNNKLKTPITDNRYRPNIIISGTTPYEEEKWKSITIGNCEFDVITPTERCSLITINPNTLEKSITQEPLRTLAKNRRAHEKVNFGIYLIPKNSGTIHQTDLIKVIL